MNYISLEDNQFNTVTWKEAWKVDEKSTCPEFDGKIKEELEYFSNNSLANLAKSNGKKGSIVVFPSRQSNSDLNKDDKFIFRLVYHPSGNPSFQTNNVMGFIGLCDDMQMEITSRFDKTEHNFLLFYMLQKVLNIALTPKISLADESYLDFLYYLFPSYLKTACAQGIYRAYVTKEYNDANVRGPIDVARHIRCNTPFNGKIAYHTREYTTDNKVTQLIRHAIEYIRTLKSESSILSSDNDVRDDVNEIIAATPTYSHNAMMQVIAQNLHPITHPYYTAYEPLRKLCLGILLHKKAGFGDSEKKIRGILFDGASLWEEYLNVVLKKKFGSELVHPNNRTGDKNFYLFEDEKGVIYPDFLVGLYGRETAKIVLDAKYKHLDETDLDSGNNNDSFQMLAYMTRFKAQNGVLIYPCENTGKKTSISTKSYKLWGNKNISVYTVPVKIPTSNDWKIFVTQMKSMEGELVEMIQKIK